MSGCAAPDRPAGPNTDTAKGFGSSSSNLSKRPVTRTSGQPAPQQAANVRTSLHLVESGSRPNSTGVQVGQARTAPALQVDTQERSDENSHVVRTPQAGQVATSKDTSLRTSKDGRPISRPGAAAQSPYLQPPGGRTPQASNHRPTSRPQSQQSPQPQQSPQALASLASQPTAAPSAPAASPTGAQRAQGNSSSTPGATSLSNGARIFQTYGAPPPRSLQSMAAGASQHLNSQAHPKQLQQQSTSGGHVRPSEQQQQQARASVAQQQQQAGPRATTALSGARSMQRGKQESGSGAMGPAETGPMAGQHQQPALRAGGGAASPAAGAAHHTHPYHANHHQGGHLGSGPGGLSGREAEHNAASFGYDDIPEEDEETSSPQVSNAYSGLTLDKYMQRMVTTPASAAATSGLGVSADSEESAPCSPGNASTRTEEEDSPYSAPGPVTPPSPSRLLSRDTDGGGGSDRHVMAGRGAAAHASAMAGHSPPSIPRLGISTRASVAGMGSVSGLVGQQRGGGNGGGGGNAFAPGGSARSSGTNQPPGRGPTGAGGAAARGAGSAYDDMYSGGGMVPDVSSLLDCGSSDDEQLNPTTLLDSSRNSRRLSSRASAMAFSNSLDLRPATAAVASSPSMTRGENTPRGISMGLAADTGNHHAIIKQVDLGGLSASLFTPNPSTARESGSPSTANNLGNDLLMMSHPSSPEMATVAAGRGDRRAAAAAAAAGGVGTSVLRSNGSSSGDNAYITSPYGNNGGGSGAGMPKMLASPKTPMSAIPPPWGVSAREGAFGGGPAGDGAGGSSSLQALAARPLSSRGRLAAAAGCGGGDGMATSPGSAAAAAGWPAPGTKWVKPQPQQKSDAGSGPPVMELPPEARQLAAESQSMARPPTRQVQSARPPGTRGEIELDPSVWQANIAMQLQRPPSRQKPPPEALHLWTPEQQMSMLSSGGLGRPGGSGRPLGGRPQSAAPTTYRSSRPTSGPSVKAHGPVGDDLAGSVARPPSRQKPPPLSTLLEHDDFPPPPPPGSRRPRPGADQLDVVVSGSEDDDDSDL